MSKNKLKSEVAYLQTENVVISIRTAFADVLNVVSLEVDFEG